VPGSGRKRSIAGRLLALSLAASALCFAGSLGLGCGPEKVEGECIGGVVVNGVCEGKCTPDKCIQQNTCVGNRCLLLCASHAECHPDGEQSCLPAKEDDSGKDVLVCQPGGKPVGMGASCLGEGCSDWLACPDGGGCSASQCGGDPGACALDEAACGGTDGCAAGKCPDGSACRVGCAADCAPWLTCEGTSAEDANAYCTLRDCASDDDCIAGFHCGVVRAPHDVCGPVCQGDPGVCAGGPRDGQPCGGDGECQKGNDALCGQTAEPCKTPGQGGGSYFEGSVCLLRRSCLKRGPGDACQSDADCSRIPGQVCASAGGETRCAQACSTDFDCLPDSACDAAQGACLPRFGAWVGTGGFCEPCVTDEDCGEVGTSRACVLIPGTGRACFDVAYPDECASDADCPVSPSGLHGACLDEGEEIGPADPLYHRCSLPISAETGKPTCW
jgi:hypothetical protein